MIPSVGMISHGQSILLTRLIDVVVPSRFFFILMKFDVPVIHPFVELPL